MNFERKQTIQDAVEPKRVLVIYGPRRVGKTTLLTRYLEQFPKNECLSSTGDDIKLRELFRSQDRDRILEFARPYARIAIDEAQFIPSIGLGTKMIIDAFPEKEIILTGSSSLDLSQKIGEPLTGRHFVLTLMPIAQKEFTASRFELQGALEQFLVYGSYPEVVLEPDPTRRVKILNELVASYLFKDALTLEAVRSPDTLHDVAKCLAFQVGGEVSINEVARSARTDAKTTARYLDLLEKMFIVKRVRGFSRNLRNEIVKKAKYYFLDNGVRNAIIAQFNPLTFRNDVGALWENFIAMELMKKSAIEERFDNYYFWRTHTGQEIDIIRESEGKIMGIECKYGDRVARPSRLWSETYPDAEFLSVNRKNYLDVFLKRGNNKVSLNK